jgi:hypothetical protein
VAPTALGVPLPKIGLCADISVDPKKTPSFDFATHPGAIVDVCMNKDAKQFLYASLTDPYGDDVVQGKLAQRSPNASGYDPISLRTRPVAGLLTSADCDSDPLTTSPPSGQAIGSALSRLGHAVLALFTPQTAHASHGGLGTMPGFADDLSIFGGWMATCSTRRSSRTPSARIRSRGRVTTSCAVRGSQTSSRNRVRAWSPCRRPRRPSTLGTSS